MSSLTNPPPGKRFTIDDALRAANIQPQAKPFNPYLSNPPVVPHSQSSLYSILHGKGNTVDSSNFDFGKVEIHNSANMIPAQRHPMVITSQNLRPPEIKVTNLSNSTGYNLNSGSGNLIQPANNGKSSFLSAPLMTVSELSKLRNSETNSNVYRIQKEVSVLSILDDPSSPQAMQEFIRRSFLKCLNADDRAEMEKQVSHIVRVARLKDELKTKDWRNCPLPTLNREKIAAAMPKPEARIKMPAKSNHGSNSLTYLSQSQQQRPAPKKIELLKKSAPVKKVKLEIVDDPKKLKSRQERFVVSESTVKKAPVSFSKVDETEALARYKVQGTSTAIEKQFLRLTSEPDPSTVRPEPILKKSLKHVISRWKKGEVVYSWVEEQFRSIRQDLIVQHIRNEFSVRVYEKNAKISLENFDLNQFNQCQSKLYDLYREGKDGKKMEFISYRILYLFLSNLSNELNRLLFGLSNDEFGNKHIRIAIKLTQFIELGNFYGFFKTVKALPKSYKCLVSFFNAKLRVLHLQSLTKGFGAAISFAHLAAVCHLENEKEAKEMVDELGGLVSEDGTSLLLRESHSWYKEHPVLKKRDYSDPSSQAFN